MVTPDDEIDGDDELDGRMTPAEFEELAANPMQLPPVITGRGGRRPGAGRPRYSVPPEIVARIGPPPTDKPLKMARWWQRVLAELAWLQLQGRGMGSLTETMRSLAGTAAKIIPPDLTYAATRALAEDQDVRDSDTGPQTEELDDSPERTRALRSRPR